MFTRTCSAAGVVVLAGAAVLAAGSTASAGSQPVIGLGTPAYFYSATPGVPHAPKEFRVDVVARQDDPAGEVTARNVRLTVDASALAGKMRLLPDPERDDPCAVNGMTATCQDVSGFDGTWSFFPFSVEPLPGARAGDGGVVTVSVTSDNAGSATASTTFVVGGPALATRDHAPIGGIAPDTAFPFTPAVRNTGDVPVTGVEVDVTTSGHLLMPGQYANCRYQDLGGADPDGRASCVFPDLTLRPGEAYAFAAPMSFKADAALMYAKIRYSVRALGTGGTAPGGQPGPGPAVGMRPTAPTGFTTALPAQSAVSVATTQHAGYAALGGAITGPVGSTRTLTVGARELGPGSMDGVQGGAGAFTVTLPAGVTMVGSLADTDGGGGWLCTPAKPARPVYTCGIGSRFAPGDSRTLDFTVRVDRAVPGAEGSVTVAAGAGRPNRDTDHADDTAPISVLVTDTGGSAAGGTPSGGPSTGTPGTAPSGGRSAVPGGPGGATGSGGLADTGAARVVLLAGCAAVVLGIGTGTLALIRGRRAV